MKKILLLTLALTPSAVWAQPQQCLLGNATLNGTYVLRSSGTVMITNTSAGIPIAAVGLITFDGQGNFRTSFTGNLNGNVVKGFPGTGTYTLRNDCTGSLTLVPGPSHYDLVVSPDGKKAYSLQTDPGTVTTQRYIRQDH